MKARKSTPNRNQSLQVVSDGRVTRSQSRLPCTPSATSSSRQGHQSSRSNTSASTKSKSSKKSDKARTAAGADDNIQHLVSTGQHLSHAPRSSSSDDEHITDDAITSAGREFLGIERLRQDQVQVIRSALDGKDSIVAFPTGYGKSACFQLLPKLRSRGMVIVLSPLLALAADQVRITHPVVLRFATCA